MISSGIILALSFEYLINISMIIRKSSLVFLKVNNSFAVAPAGLK